MTLPPPPAHPAHAVVGKNDDVHPDWRPLRGVAAAQVRVGGFRNADVIIAELDGLVEAAALQTAMRALCARHPVLRAELRTTPEPRFRVRPQPLAAPVVELFDGPWQEAARDAISKAIGDRGPIWRLLLVPGSPSYVVLAVHHAFVDGRSLSILLRDLLTQLADPSTTGEPTAPLSVLDLWKPPTWIRLGLSVGRRLWAWRAIRSQARVQLRGARLGADDPVPVWFGGRTLAPGLLPALVKRARAEKATVGGALMAAAWSATHALLQRRAGPGANAAMIEAMVDLRPTLPGAPDVGMFASGATALPARAPADPWERARGATARLKRQVDWKVPLLIHALADGVDVPAFLARAGLDLHRDGGAASGVGVSNVGVWGFGTRFGHLTLRGAWSATSAMRTGPPMLAWLRTVDGRGCLSAISNGAVTSLDDLNFWLETLETHLQEMLRS